MAMEEFTSSSFALPCGVPPGSSLSPTLFNLYVMPLANLIKQFIQAVVSYADDTQIVVSVSKNLEVPAANFHNCMKQISHWMFSNCLKLNSSKTEVLLLGNNTSFWSPDWWPQELGDPPVLVSKVKNLGIGFHDRLSFEKQINCVTSSCFFTLKILRKVFSFIPVDLKKLVITALILSKLD